MNEQESKAMAEANLARKRREGMCENPSCKLPAVRRVKGVGYCGRHQTHIPRTT